MDERKLVRTALVVDDDQRLAELIRRCLEEEGALVDVVHDGVAALARLLARPHDVCIVDGMLPELDGLEVIRRARDSAVTTPFLMLTARDSVDDRVRGLQVGADDYLVKPFAFAELLARVAALVRRSRRMDKPQVAVHGLDLDARERTVRRDGVQVALTEKQFGLLELLVDHVGETVTREMILEHVFHTRFDPGTNVVDVHIRNLRQRIDRSDPSLIETVRGLGYRMRRVDP